jgi:hypothetical protein
MATEASTIVLFRFDESASDARPQDAIGSVGDLTAAPASALGAVADGFAGFARTFGAAQVLQATDLVTGASLATRDCTVDMLVKWDYDTQQALAGGGAAGVVVTRGIGGSTAEYVAYAVELRVVNFTLRIGEIRWVWFDTAGVEHALPGGQFQMPSSANNGFMFLTATRHWVSPTEVHIEYYLADQQLAAHVVPDGDIGGGTTGTFRVGGAAAGMSNANVLAGLLDELRVRKAHVTAEEVGATWARLSRWQPAGYKMVQQMFQTDAPVSDAPESRAQRLFRGIGHGLGYAMAQIDNLRSNALPDRAFGGMLASWERATTESARPGDDELRRRRRVVGHWKQRQGTSVPGAGATVAELLQCDASQLQVLAFTQDIVDTFSAALDPKRWWISHPTTPTITFESTIGAPNQLRIESANGASAPFNTLPNGYFLLTTAQARGTSAHTLVTIATGPTQNGEVGLCFVDWPTGMYVLYGLRNVGGTQQLWREGFSMGVSIGASLLAAGPVSLPVHLHLWHEPAGVGGDPAFATYHFESAATRPGPYTAYPTLSNASGFGWAGIYARTTGALVGAMDARLDDYFLRCPFGSRPFDWYIYRDPAIPGTPDLIGAQAALDRLRHAHTRAAVITTKVAVADTTSRTCGLVPMGGF